MIDKEAFKALIVEALRSPEVQTILHDTVQHAVRGEISRVLEDELLDTAGAAKLLNIKEGAMRMRYKRGQVPVVKHGKRVLFRRADLLRLSSPEPGKVGKKAG